MRHPSASRWPRVVACPASHVLPQEKTESGDPARMGIAVHKFLEEAATDPKKALENVPEFARGFCEAVPLDALPVDCNKFTPELWMAYYPDTDSAEIISKGARPDGAIVCVADVVGVSSDHIYLADYKTGFVQQARVSVHWQMKIMALIVSRVFKKYRVRAEILALRDDGNVWPDMYEFDAMELDEIMLKVLDTLHAIEEMRKIIDELGGLPGDFPTHSGEHCRYCPAFSVCPSKINLVRHLATAPETLKDGLALTPENARAAHFRLNDVEDLVKRLRKQVDDFARETPIDLGDGTELREGETKRQSLDGAIAAEVLQTIYGSEVAKAAVKLTVTKEAMKTALRPMMADGVTLKSLMEEAMAELERQEGVKTKYTKSVKVYKILKKREKPANAV